MGKRSKQVVQGYQNPYALQFDGVTSYGQALNAGLPTAAGSMSAWIRIDSALLINSYNFIGGDSGNSWFVLGKGGSTTSLVIRGLFSSSGLTSNFLAGAHNVGQWYHYLATFDGTNFRCYIDGVNYATTNRAGQTLTVVGTNMWFARGGAAGYSPITVDEVSIWNRAIDVNEVASANKPIDIYGASGLLRWYRMGELFVSGSSTITNRVDGTSDMTLFNISESTDFVTGVS